MPFYARLGFEVIPSEALSPALRSIVQTKPVGASIRRGGWPCDGDVPLLMADGSMSARPVCVPKPESRDARRRACPGRQDGGRGRPSNR